MNLLLKLSFLVVVESLAALSQLLRHEDNLRFLRFCIGEELLETKDWSSLEDKKEYLMDKIKKERSKMNFTNNNNTHNKSNNNSPTISSTKKQSGNEEDSDIEELDDSNHNHSKEDLNDTINDSIAMTDT